MATLADVRTAITTHTEFVDLDAPLYLDTLDKFAHTLEDGTEVTVWIESYKLGQYAEGNMDELALSMWQSGKLINASTIMVDDYAHADFLELVVNSINHWLAAHVA